MWTVVIIGSGIVFILLGIIFRSMAESAKGNAADRRRLPELVSIFCFFLGTIGLIAGVIFLILALGQDGLSRMDFNLFGDDSIATQSVEPENTAALLEQGQAEVIIGYPNGNMVEIAGAMASSEMKSPDTQITYYANYAIDGDNGTCWQASGDEENAELTIFLKGKNKVSAVAFNIGNQAEDSYVSYNRPRIIRIGFPDGKYVYATFEDTEMTQTVLLPKTVKADTLTVTIVDFYAGVNNSTCISEIYVYS